VYCEGVFKAQAVLILDQKQSHYLHHVMRIKRDDPLRVFNEPQGEWRAKVVSIEKKAVKIILEEVLRPPETQPFRGVLLPLIRQERMSLIVEKATELGVSHFFLLKTEYSNVKNVAVERLTRIAIEAAEQSERLTIPQFKEVQGLDDCLYQWEESFGVPIVVGGEKDAERPLQSLLQELVQNQETSKMPQAILIGPEGGFSDREHALLKRYNFLTRVSLGQEILRVETAVLYLLSFLKLVTIEK